MLSKEEVTERINEFKGMLEKDGIMSDSDGDTVDLTVHMVESISDIIDREHEEGIY